MLGWMFTHHVNNGKGNCLRLFCFISYLEVQVLGFKPSMYFLGAPETRSMKLSACHANSMNKSPTSSWCTSLGNPNNQQWYAMLYHRFLHSGGQTQRLQRKTRKAAAKLTNSTEQLKVACETVYVLWFSRYFIWSQPSNKLDVDILRCPS